MDWHKHISMRAGLIGCPYRGTDFYYLYFGANGAFESAHRNAAIHRALRRTRFYKPKRILCESHKNALDFERSHYIIRNIFYSE
jgi:hypothetical protein